MVCGVGWYSILLKERFMLPCSQVFKKMATCVCACVCVCVLVNTNLQFQKKSAQ